MARAREASLTHSGGLDLLTSDRLRTQPLGRAARETKSAGRLAPTRSDANRKYRNNLIEQDHQQHKATHRSSARIQVVHGYGCDNLPASNCSAGSTRVNPTRQSAPQSAPTGMRCWRSRPAIQSRGQARIRPDAGRARLLRGLCAYAQTLELVGKGQLHAN